MYVRLNECMNECMYLRLQRAVKSADFIFSVADDALAYHLTIIDFHFFSQIEPHELMNKV